MHALTRIADRIDRWRRRLLWHRRPLAAVLAAAAAYVAVQAATAPPPPTVPLWTAARELPSGTVLSSADLRQRSFTPQSVPADHIADPAEVVGRTLATPLARGAVVPTDAVVDDGWLARRPGRAAVPLRITDPAVVPLLAVGDRVTLVAVDPRHPGAVDRLVSMATVLALPDGEDTADAGLTGRLVLFGVPTESASRLAATTAGMFLTVVWTQ